MATTPREGAYEILNRFEKGRGRGRGGSSTSMKPLKADQLINDILAGPAARQWSPSDRALLTALTYGVLRRWRSLESVIQSLSRFPWEKTQREAKTLLRLGLFQLRYLDQIPDYAAVDTTVTLAKEKKLSNKTTAFINGILREYLRRAASQTALPDAASLPEWVEKRLQGCCSPAELAAMAQVIQTPPPLTLRVNTLKTSVTDYLTQLEQAGVGVRAVDETLPEMLMLDGFYGTPQSLPGYDDGCFYVQDLSSALVGQALQVQPGETVVDLCAAPGSKTTQMAALMNNQGNIWAVDPSKDRLKLLQDNLNRLGVTCVQLWHGDALTFEEIEQADRVLVDAPCSGLGTVRKHPEILIQLQEGDMNRFAKQQRALLERGLGLLKPGGVLVYATCSLDAAENEDVVAAVLKKCSGVSLTSEHRRPVTDEGDGFYWAVIQKDPML